MKNIGIYCRCSTRDQTTIQQIKSLEEYCDRKGLTIHKIYVDEGISAFKKHRPEFQALLEDARMHKIKSILVFKTDRFSRSVRELVNTMSTLKDYGVDFMSLSEPQFDTSSASGSLVFHMFSAIAQFERDLISERVKLKLNYLKSLGVQLGRKKTVDNEKVFELRSQGLSLSQIGKAIGCHRSSVCKVLKKGNSVVLHPSPAAVAN